MKRHMWHAGFNPGAEALDRMAAQSEAQLGRFSSQNISNALGSYAKLDHKPLSLLIAIARSAVTHLESFTPQASSPSSVHVLMLLHQASAARGAVGWDEHKLAGRYDMLIA